MGGQLGFRSSGAILLSSGVFPRRQAEGVVPAQTLNFLLKVLASE